MIGIGATVGVITGGFNLDFVCVNDCSAWFDVSVGSRGFGVLNPVLFASKSEGVRFNGVITVGSVLGVGLKCAAKSSVNTGDVDGAGAGAVGAIGLKCPAPVDISAKNPLVCDGCVKMLVAGGVGCNTIFIAGWVDVADCGMDCPICAENGCVALGNIFIGACNALDGGIAGVGV